VKPYTHPLDPSVYLNWFVGPTLPDDPGGELTPHRIDVLRAIASARGHGAMLNALEEIESLRAEHRRAEIEMGLLRRVAAEARWAGWSALVDWPPAWLVEMVEQGRADAIQADRSSVLSTANLGGVPAVPSPGRRWWTNAEPPSERDEDTYQAARRVLMSTMGRGQ
jgi:hypothetical protein